jgi:hypothetical protein
VRPLLIVFVFPAAAEGFGLFEIGKDLRVEKFIAQAGLKRFGIADLRGAPGSTQRVPTWAHSSPVALPLPQAADALTVDFESFSAKKGPDPAIVAARMGQLEFFHADQDQRPIFRDLKGIALGRPVLPSTANRNSHTCRALP